ncbi:MAG: Secretion system C-terminal sorting domain [Bacteroidota bacterium]|jgi:hypothetical protein
MKKSLRFIAFFFVAILFWEVTTALDPTNPPTAATGAPTETTCSSRSGCHTGGAYTGTITYTGLPDTVVANATYTVTLRAAVANAVNTGFEVTSLDGANATSGTFTAGTGSGIISAGGRQYIRNTTRTSYAAGAAAWTFTWKAPATAATNRISFYHAVMAANGGGTTAGDNAISGSKTVVFKLASGVKDLNPMQISVYPNPTSSFLTIKNESIPNGMPTTVVISDFAGRIVLRKTLTDVVTTLDVEDWAKGAYSLRINDGKTTDTRQIILK